MDPTTFKFALGEIVFMNPLGEDIGHKGKIMALVLGLDGSRGYMVSWSTFSGEGISRQFLGEHEIGSVPTT